eukprot:6542075-Prymnesium_polylepis.1
MVAGLSPSSFSALGASRGSAAMIARERSAAAPAQQVAAAPAQQMVASAGPFLARTMVHVLTLLADVVARGGIGRLRVPR